jgi:hypothetical protein
MYCNECREELKEDEKFCGNCGAEYVHPAELALEDDEFVYYIFKGRMKNSKNDCIPGVKNKKVIFTSKRIIITDNFEHTLIRSFTPYYTVGKFDSDRELRISQNEFNISKYIKVIETTYILELDFVEYIETGFGSQGQRIYVKIYMADDIKEPLVYLMVEMIPRENVRLNEFIKDIFPKKYTKGKALIF